MLCEFQKTQPSQKDKDINIKQLGAWLSRQIRNYKTKKERMSDIKIYDTWTEFINNDKYKIYFLSINEEWFEQFEKVINYINKYNSRPSSMDEDNNIKKLGKWIVNQSKNYKLKSCIMANENIYNKWTEFINNIRYKKLFLSNDEVWYYNFEDLKLFININNYKPLQTTELGKWMSHQSRNYKLKSCIMADENIYNKWNEFINDNKYKKYFLSNEEEWYIKLNIIIDYINTFNKRPSSTNNNTNIKQLGVWIVRQIINYKNKKEIMKNKEIYDAWTTFINDSLYKKYFD